MNDRLAKRIAHVAFLVLFPGFFLWQAALARGLAPLPINLYAEASVLVLLLYTLTLPAAFARFGQAPVLSTCLIAMMLWCGLWTIGAWLSIPDLPLSSITQVAITYILWCSLFVTGLFIDLDAKKFRRVLWAAFAACSVVGVIYFDGSIIKFSGDTDQNVYQGLARSVALTAAALAAGLRDGPLRILLVAYAVGLLFIVGARSELAAMAIAFGAYELIRFLIRPSSFKVLLPCLVVCVGAAYYWQDTIAATVQNSRQLQLLDLEDATSWQARELYSQYAWASIENSPFLGEFGGHFNVPNESNESGGSYAHSAISAWVSFGLIGFVLYLAVNAIAVASAIRQAFVRSTTSLWRIAFYITVSSTILIGAAKPVFWATPAIGWGLVIAARTGVRKRQKQFPGVMKSRRPIVQALPSAGTARTRT